MSNSVSVRLNKIQLGFPKLFVPQAMPGVTGAKPKYSAMLVIPMGPEADKVSEALTQIYQGEFKGKGEIRSPMKLAWDSPTGGYAGSELYKDKYIMNASNMTRPGVVDHNLTSLSEDSAQGILYPGSLANVSITLAPYNMQMNKGISCYLEAVQLIGGGERLDFRRPASEIFEKVEATPMPEEPAGVIPSFLQ